jgi:hypothetical protein
VLGFWKYSIFLFRDWPILALKNNLYIHITVSTYFPGVRLKSSSSYLNLENYIGTRPYLGIMNLETSMINFGNQGYRNGAILYITSH